MKDDLDFLAAYKTRKHETSRRHGRGRGCTRGCISLWRPGQVGCRLRGSPGVDGFPFDVLPCVASYATRVVDATTFCWLRMKKRTRHRFHVQLLNP